MVLQSDIDRAGRRVAWLLAGYVALWIVEGAFRKWVPGTSLVFFVLRDAYAVGLLIWLASSRVPPRRRMPWWAVAGLLVITVLLVIQYGQTDAPPATVLLFGLRSYLAPFLFALLCFQFGTRETFRRCFAIVAAFAPVELLLAVLQVSAPAEAVINQQVGGDPNIFVNGDAAVRATGTFSAPTGLTAYLLIATAVALWMTVRSTRPAVAWGVVMCTLGTVALSGARGSVLNAGLLLAVFIAYLLARPTARSIGTVVVLLVMVAIALLVVQLTLPDVIAAFVTRFNDASGSEDSSARVLDGFVGFVTELPTTIGDGMGSRSNAGIALGSTSGWLENDGLRWVAELGVLGYLLGLVRIGAAALLTVVAIRGLRRDPVEVAMLRAALVALLVLGSLNATPTNEGAFAIILGGLVLAGQPRRTDDPAPQPVARTRPALHRPAGAGAGQRAGRARSTRAPTRAAARAAE